MPTELCIHCIVTGRVQGVWFRANTRDKAQALGLKGWVRNLPEGQVEVLACGSPEKTQELYQWLHQGPTLAKVEKVSLEQLPWEEHEDFSIR